MTKEDSTKPDQQPAAEGKPLFDYKVGADHPGRHMPRKMPKPHRCNDHMEDLIQGIYHAPREFWEPFKVWVKCVRSEEGQEPKRHELKNGRNL